jgi:Asp-tRNA(Asn)/Glu-tRNA(Gln) amidotransferase A subunit family amidase
MDAHAFGSATQLAVEIRDRRIGCLELLDFHLARAERRNPALNAIIAWQINVARQRARDADAALVKGEAWGPLHGIPMTVKESFNVAGYLAIRCGRTTSRRATRSWSIACCRPAQSCLGRPMSRTC